MSTVYRDGVSPAPDESSKLRVRISRDLRRPSDSHQLLLAFHFGTGPAPVWHPSLVSPSLTPACGEDHYECWWYAGEVRNSTDGEIRIAECRDYTVAIYTRSDDADDDIETLTRNAYVKMLEALAKCKHKRPVKIWNYIGDINNGDQDNERYRQFSVGRAQAFETRHIRDDLSPTGTAIGTNRTTGLSIIAIATSNDFSLAENPRQVSAFKYPRQYGRSSPKFGRGGCVSTASHKLYLISGTASVVGHESLHPYNARQQLSEILRNLDALCRSISMQNGNIGSLTLDNNSILRVYLRKPEDAAAIEVELRSGLSLGKQPVLFLIGDICRRELMVEIDGINVLQV